VGARLIAICDSFQAMLSDRPYRAALTLEEARAEIRRGAGVQFDPTLARLFLERCRTSGATVPQPAAADGPLGARSADDGDAARDTDASRGADATRDTDATRGADATHGDR